MKSRLVSAVGCLGILILLLSGLPGGAMASPGADFSFEPSTQTVNVDEIFTVDIRVDASTQEVDSVGAYVNFSTAYVKVVNASGDVISGTAENVIVPGAITNTNLTTRTKNLVDNTNGYADISYGMPPGGTPANTSFILGTIRFKALAEVTDTALLFNISGIRNTKAVRLGVVVTGTRTNGAVTIRTVDLTPPTVTDTSPANGDTSVAVDATVQATLSEAMNQASVEGAFSISPTVSGAFSWVGNVLTFTPDANLATETTYTVTIGTGAEDLAGNNLAAHTWSFTTIIIPPTVISNTPADGAASVPVTFQPVVTFSKPMNAGSVVANYSITPAIGAGYTFTWTSSAYGSNTVVTLNHPGSPFAYSTTYTIKITGAATDAGGTGLDGDKDGAAEGSPTDDYSWSFTTAAAPDLTSPAVTDTAPANGATGVAISTTVQVTFSEAMNQASAEGAFSIAPTVSGAFGWAGNVMTFTPGADLAYGTTYTATIGTGAEDLAGNNLAAPYVFSFTMEVVPPSVITDTAVVVAHDSAVIQGTLSSPGSAASVRLFFEWGTSGENTIAATPSIMSESGIFLANLTGLEPNTTYQFRAKAVGDETAFGDWVTFDTLDDTGVHFSIQPALQAVSIDQFFLVDIRVDAGSQEVDSAGAYINFNTTFVKVVNASGEVISGTAEDVIIRGAITDTNLTTRTKNLVDNTNGYADISYGMPPGGTPASDSFVLGTIRFKALAEVESTAVLFNTSGIRNTKAVRLGVVVTGNRTGGIVAIPAVDIIPPTVMSTSPANSATGVLVGANISVTFSEEMNQSSAQGAFSISPTVAGTFSWGSPIMTFDPTANLAYNTTYTVTIGTGAKDLADNPMAAPYTFSFTTQPTVAPTVSTAAVTSLTTNSVTLNGSLDSLGTAGSVQVYFQWGKTIGYGSTTTAQTKSATGAFTANLTGLSAGVTYHYRAVAAGAHGTSHSDDATFTTLTTPPAVTTNPATAIGVNSATLNAALTGLGTASTVTLSFQYGTTNQYGSTVAGVPVSRTTIGSFMANLTGLAAGQTYHFRVKADGGIHGVSYGADATFTTGTTPPTVTTAAATNITGNSATLNGNLTVLGTLVTVPNVQVSFEYGTVSGTYTGTTTAQAMTAIGAFNVSITGLLPSTRYYYRAKAVGDGTAAGSEMSFMTATVLLSIQISPQNPTVAMGRTKQFNATGVYSNGSAPDVTAQVTWESSQTGIATIGEHTGLARSVAEGQTNITARLGEVSATTTLTVAAKVLDKITVAPVNPSVAKGRAQQFTATGTFSDGSTETPLTGVAWSSSDTIKAMIGADTGLAQTLAEGQTVITASRDGINGRTTLTVTAKVLDSIAVTPANPNVAKGRAQQFTATGIYSDQSTANLTTLVNWTSSDTAKATMSATTKGLAQTLAEGQTTIQAALAGVTGSTTLTIGPKVLDSIAVAPAAVSVPLGDKQQFTATGTYSDKSTANLTADAGTVWASSNTAKATINATGEATTVAIGSTYITAVNSGITSNRANLTIGSPILKSIAIAPTDPNVPKGRTQQFTATGTYSDGSKPDITGLVKWDSSDKTKATIDAAGLAKTLAQGTTNITAAMGDINASTVLTVGDPVAESLVITPDNPSAPKGKTVTFQATAYLSDGTPQVVAAAWESSAATIASIDPATGVATAQNVGTATITATFGSSTDTTLMTVSEPTLESIAIVETAPTVAAGKKLQLHLNGTLSDGSPVDLTATATWASLNRAIATISTTGEVTGVVKGTVDITATHTGMRKTVNLEVTDPVLESIAVTPANPSIALGFDVKFTATGTYSNGTTAVLTTVEWSSSDESIATISAAGLATSKAPGTTTIKAKVGTVEGTTTLTVTGKTLQSITVTPATPSVPVGKNQQFTATGNYSDTTSDDLTAVVHWASSDAAKATMAAGGLATTRALGTSNITATLGTVSGSTLMTVIDPVLDKITVTPANPSVPAGRTKVFTATGTYSDGSTRNLTATATWESSDTGKATVVGGLAMTIAQGTTDIKAKVGTVEGVTTLTVAPPILIMITLAPATPSIAAGKTQTFTATGTLSDGSAAPPLTGLIWTSTVVSVASVNNTGTATGNSVGQAVITAAKGEVVGMATLKVTVEELESITVSPANQTIVLGKNQQFHAMGTYTNGTRADVTDRATWSSSTGAATMSTTTKGLAISAAEGTTQMKAKVGAIEGTTNLTVTAATLDSIAVTPGTPTIAAGRTLPFTAMGTYSYGPAVDITGLVTWSSSNTTVAHINAAGLATSFAPGTTLITASMTTPAGTVTSPAATLTVGDAELDSVTVTPLNPEITLVAGHPALNTLKFTATAKYSDGATANVTTAAVWGSSDTAVADIGANTGVATAASDGAATIQADFGGETDSTMFTVLPDKTAPVVTLTSPTEGLIISEKSLTVSGKVSDSAATAKVIVNGVSHALALDPTTGNFSQGVQLNSGNNTILVTASDTATPANTGASPARNVIVNPNKPTVTITSPADRLLTNNPALTVTGTITNATKLTLRVNGVPREVTADAGGNWSTVVPLVERPSNSNIITASAYTTIPVDHTGDPEYLGTSGTITVLLDTTAPVVNLTSPSAGSVVSAPAVEVAGIVDDPAVTSVKLILNGTPLTEDPGVVGGSFSQIVTLVPGSNTIEVKARDAIGNSSSATVQITLDTAKPKVTLLTPNKNQVFTNAAGYKITGSVDDPAIRTATLVFNGTAQPISVAPDGSFSQTVTLLPLANTIEVQASDNATPRNTGTSGVFKVTLDTTPPNLTIGLSDPTDSIIITVSPDEPLREAPTVSINPTIAMTRVGASWVGTYGSESDPIDPGDYVVSITGTDRAGNTATSTATFSKETIDVDGETATTVQNASTTLEIETNGEVTGADISLTQHMENPSGNVGHPEDATLGAGAFVEINASAELRDNLRRIYIRVDYDPADVIGIDEFTLKLYLWDVTLGMWRVVEDSQAHPDENFLDGWTDHLSKYGVFGKPVIITPTAGGGAAAVAPTPVEVSGLLSPVALRVDAAGVVQDAVHLKTPDEKAAFDIPAGVKMTDAQGNALATLTAAIQDKPPAAPPEGAILIAYNFGPDGAQFDPPIALTVKYDPMTLPAGVGEDSLYLAYWDGSQWQMVEGEVNADMDSITAKVSHFTDFAVLAKLPAPPPKPASFTVSALSVNPGAVKADEAVTVSALVANTGGSQGSYTVVLKVNGFEEARKELTLDAGSGQTVSFTVRKTAAATYKVDVNGLSGAFTVKEEPKPTSPATPELTPTVPPSTPTPPVTTPASPTPTTPGAVPSAVNWSVVIAIILAVIAVALVVYFTARRRRAAGKP